MFRITNFPVNIRLTPERKEKVKVRSFLRPLEREIFFKILENQKGALIFNFPEYKTIYKDISPLVEIKTILYKL